MKSQPRAAGKAASKLISERIAELGDWRGDALARMRALIREADPEVVEEWKWMGTPVWSHEGGICTGESYKSIVKLVQTRRTKGDGEPGDSRPEPTTTMG